MAKAKTLEPYVKEALINNPKARGDNFTLYVEVLRNFIDVDGMSFATVCAHHVTLGIPSLETITRVRRKIQETNPDLRDEKAVRKRAEEETDILDYVRSC